MDYDTVDLANAEHVFLEATCGKFALWDISQSLKLEHELFDKDKTGAVGVTELGVVGRIDENCISIRVFI